MPAIDTGDQTTNASVSFVAQGKTLRQVKQYSPSDKNVLLIEFIEEYAY